MSTGGRKREHGGISKAKNSSSAQSSAGTQQRQRFPSSTSSLASLELSLTQQEELTNDVGWANSPERSIEFKHDREFSAALHSKKPKLLRGKKSINLGAVRPPTTKPSEKFLALMDSMDVVDASDVECEAEPLTSMSGALVDATASSVSINTSTNVYEGSVGDLDGSQSVKSETGILSDSYLHDDKNDSSSQFQTPPEIVSVVAEIMTKSRTIGIAERASTNTADDKFTELSESDIAMLEAIEAKAVGDDTFIELTADALAKLDEIEANHMIANSLDRRDFVDFSEEDLAFIDAMEKDALSKPFQDPKIDITSSSSSCILTRDISVVDDISIPSVCLRCIALDVVIHVDKRLKEIRSFQAENQKDISQTKLNNIFTVVLTGEWYDTIVSGGDVFHVVFLTVDGMNEHGLKASDVIYVSDTAFLFIVHPDLLIAPSKLSDSISCARRGVLNERSKLSGSSKAAVLGNIKHEFIERFLDVALEFIKLLDSFDATQVPEFILKQEEITNMIHKIQLGHLHNMYQVGLSDEEVAHQLQGIVPGLVRWIHEFTPECISMCKQKVSGSVRYVNYTRGECSTKYSIEEISGVEENLWCPMIGVKGQIDIVASARAIGPAVQFDSNKPYNLAVEIKTGKWHPTVAISHRAQTILYILMLLLRDKDACPFPLHGQVGASSSKPVRHGILLYISNEGVRSEIVEPTWMEIRNLVICRNKLAINLSIASQVASRPYPNMLRHSDCERCYSAAECMLNHAALESGSKSSSGVPVLFSYVTRCLLPVHLKYFQTWNMLIDLEAVAYASSAPLLWTASGESLEEMAEKCISGLYIMACSVVESYSIVTLKKINQLKSSYATDDPISSVVTKGDRVNISVENLQHRGVEDIEDIGSRGQFNLNDIEPVVCTGYVLSISALEIQVQVKKFPRRINRYIGQSTTDVSFRIDKDDSTVGVGTMRSNLLKLFIDSFDPNVFREFKSTVEKEASNSPDGQSLLKALPPPGNVKIRRLIVDLETPTFSSAEVPATTVATYKGCSKDELSLSFSSLNPQQRYAVTRIFSARDYVLLLGMPGTGKSSTLSHAIRSLVAKGFRVLVTSYTHSAVDTLVTKLKDAGMTQGTILRVGNTASVKESLHDLILDTEDVTSIQKMKACLESVRVVACTVLSASSDALLSHIEFDYCIVDEAGQITQPAIIGALMRSKRFVLVGDDYQLPPLVLSSEALNQGMDVSLFKRLAEAHPNAVVTLSEQYRMNMEIMEVGNALVYDQRLICGSEDVATGRLSLKPSPLHNQYPPWLVRCIEPEVPVVFVNTDNLRTSDGKLELESFVGSATARGTVVNMYEVECIARIYHGLLSCGVDAKNIGVVSPYRSQVEALKTGIKSYASVVADVSHLEVSTVDKFQGRDMDVMLLSLVRSNSHGSVGTLLRDWRRVNVAITRAKYKLVIVGSMAMTTHVPILKSLGELMKRREYVLQLQRGDIEFIYASRSDSLPNL